MESNWRMNVFDVFGSDTQFELCARLLTWLLPGQGWLVKVNPTFSATWQTAFPGAIPALISFETRDPADHFPYGLGVLPDH